MSANPFSELTERPRDIAEWEDLLVKLEIGPRALRLALDDLPPERQGAAARHFTHLAHREAEAGEWLQRMREGAPLEPWTDHTADDGAEGVQDVVWAFERLRSRTFAAAQRRGLEVWEWAATHPEFGTVTAFQLLEYLVRHDGRHLSRLRGAVAGRGAEC